MTEQQILIIADKLSKAIAVDTPLADSILELAESLKDIAEAINRVCEKLENLKYGY